MSLDIRLGRVDRIYRAKDRVSGVVVVDGGDRGFSHNGIKLRVSGTIRLHLSARSVGLFEAFYSSIKPLALIQEEITIAGPGKFAAPLTEIPFEFDLLPSGTEPLRETYHGVYVNTIYSLTCECQRGALQRPLKKEIEFIVLAEREIVPKPDDFCLAPESLENVKRSALSRMPPFRITGRLHSTLCPVNEPLRGELTVDSCAAEIRSVELQLVRIETVAYSGELAREATEIQNLQICDGDVPRNVPIPIYLVFPRLFTCPTTIAGAFSVEFELNLIVIFQSGFMVTENFPLQLCRS